jgi:hypothetical protein
MKTNNKELQEILDKTQKRNEEIMKWKGREAEKIVQEVMEKKKW